MSNDPVCKDCYAEWETDRKELSLPLSKRPAPFPGPRCATHHREFKHRAKYLNHRRFVATQFNLTGDMYDRLLAAQGGACGGCGKIPGPAAKRLAVDHDHTCCPGKTSCGKCVRGLLCHDCNSTLAVFKDDGEKLIRLARYLREWPSLKANL